MREWSVGMLRTTQRAGGYFADEAPLTLLLDGDPQTRKALDTQLTKLKDCSNAVEKIRPTPARFRAARKTALRACTHLEVGANLAELGLAAAHQGRPEFAEGLLTQAATALGKGVDLHRQLMAQLPPP